MGYRQRDHGLLPQIYVTVLVTDLEQHVRDLHKKPEGVPIRLQRQSQNLYECFHATKPGKNWGGSN